MWKKEKIADILSSGFLMKFILYKSFLMQHSTGVNLINMLTSRFYTQRSEKRKKYSHFINVFLGTTFESRKD